MNVVEALARQLCSSAEPCDIHLADAENIITALAEHGVYVINDEGIEAIVRAVQNVDALTSDSVFTR